MVPDTTAAENMFEKYSSRLLSIGIALALKCTKINSSPCHLVLENIGHVGIAWERT